MVKSRNAGYYHNLPTDIYGWVDNSNHRPKDKYELFMIKDIKGKKFQAWWTGDLWDSLNCERIPVTHWRMLRPSERCMND